LAVGTGPYKAMQIDVNKGVIVERYDGFKSDNGKKVSIGKIWGSPIPDRQTQSAELMVGNLDLLRTVPADLAKALMSINAVKGFEYGSGFDGVELRGSQHNDIIVKDEAGKVSTLTNHSGGIQGGISNGEPIYFRVGFKPVATIMQDQDSLNESGEKIVVSGKGRHDPCVVPRAVPIVEAMSAIVLLDFYLRNRLTKLSDVI
jgi:chorismate synthase